MPGSSTSTPDVSARAAASRPDAGDVVVVLELANGEVVGHDGAVETPLAAQELVEQPRVGAARHAVDLVIAVHHRTQPSHPHGRLERAQVDVAQLTVVEVGWCPVEAAFRGAVADEVLGGGDHAIREVVALQATDVGEAHLRHELRILAVRLLQPAPPGIAAQVEHGRQAVVSADCPHLQPNRVRQLGVEIRTERRRHPDRLREHGGLARHQPGADLLVDDGGDAEPCVLEQVPLQIVVEGRSLGSREPAGAADAGDVADALSEHRRRPRRVEPARARELEHPRAAELSELLVDRHPRHQVGDALGDRGRRIAVERAGRLSSWFLRGLTHSLTAPAVRPPTIWRSAKA